MDTTTFGEAAQQALIAAAASQELSTKASQTSSEADHKRHFLKTFRRWEILFKRKDGDVQADKWLVAEYYDSLRHLSEAGMDALTKRLKETSIFFPAICECLEITRASRWDYGNPFRPGSNAPMLRGSPNPRLAAMNGAITDQRTARIDARSDETEGLGP